MIFAALSAIGSIMGAQQQAAAMRRQAERQEFQGQLELLRGQQMHNDRVEAYQAFANQINTAVAFNNRSQSDRSFQAIKKAGKTASRTELNRMAAQTLFSAGRYRAAAAESRSAAGAIMLGGFINGVSGFAMNMHKYNQITPPSTPSYATPYTAMSFGGGGTGVGDG
mgnify:FL=1